MTLSPGTRVDLGKGLASFGLAAIFELERVLLRGVGEFSSSLYTSSRNFLPTETTESEEKFGDILQRSSARYCLSATMTLLTFSPWAFLPV
jgi:hypothetical protein